MSRLNAFEIIPSRFEVDSDSETLEFPDGTFIELDGVGDEFIGVFNPKTEDFVAIPYQLALGEGEEEDSSCQVIVAKDEVPGKDVWYVWSMAATHAALNPDDDPSKEAAITAGLTGSIAGWLSSRVELVKLQNPDMEILAGVHWLEGIKWMHA